MWNANIEFFLAIHAKDKQFQTTGTILLSNEKKLRSFNIFKTILSYQNFLSKKVN
jgi:hypothetical protein